MNVNEYVWWRGAGMASDVVYNPYPGAFECM